jgi:phage tail-like protein
LALSFGYTVEMQNKTKIQRPANASAASAAEPAAQRGSMGNKEVQKETKQVPTNTRKDPYRNFNFVVEIDGMAQAGFMECSGLESETEIIEYREGIDSNTIRQLPGLTVYKNIVLRRGITDSKELSNWRKGVVKGEIERKNGAIVLLDDKRQEVARWRFVEGWPNKWSGPELNAMGGDVAVEELEICHEGLEQD